MELGNTIVDWGELKKQSSKALSKCEFDYCAMSIASQEVVWIRKLLSEIELLSNGPTILLSDNQSGIS